MIAIDHFVADFSDAQAIAEWLQIVPAASEGEQWLIGDYAELTKLKANVWNGRFVFIRSTPRAPRRVVVTAEGFDLDLWKGEAA